MFRSNDHNHHDQESCFPIQPISLIVLLVRGSIVRCIVCSGKEQRRRLRARHNEYGVYMTPQSATPPSLPPYLTTSALSRSVPASQHPPAAGYESGSDQYQGKIYGLLF